jgi:hypothetical protein
MLAIATLALVMQPDSDIDIAQLIGRSASLTLLADHLATSSAGAEKVCVGLYSLSFLSCSTTGANNGDE